MYGFQVPRNYEQALELDRQNGNQKWAEATAREMSQVDDYGTFDDKGSNWKPPAGYKKITVHLICAVTMDDTKPDLLPVAI